MENNSILIGGAFFVCFFMMLFLFIWEPSDYNKFIETGRIDFTCNIYHEKGLTDKPIKAYIEKDEDVNYRLVFNNMHDKHLLELVLNTKTSIVFMNEWHKWEFIFDKHGNLKSVNQIIFEQPEHNIKRLEVYFAQ